MFLWENFIVQIVSKLIAFLQYEISSEGRSSEIPRHYKEFSLETI